MSCQILAGHMAEDMGKDLSESTKTVYFSSLAISSNKEFSPSNISARSHSRGRGEKKKCLLLQQCLQRRPCVQARLCKRMIYPFTGLLGRWGAERWTDDLDPSPRLKQQTHETMHAWECISFLRRFQEKSKELCLRKRELNLFSVLFSTATSKVPAKFRAALTLVQYRGSWEFCLPSYMLSVV